MVGVCIVVIVVVQVVVIVVAVDVAVVKPLLQVAAKSTVVDKWHRRTDHGPSIQSIFFLRKKSRKSRGLGGGDGRTHARR